MTKHFAKLVIRNTSLWLAAKLISGELRVPDVEKILEGVE